MFFLEKPLSFSGYNLIIANHLPVKNSFFKMVHLNSPQIAAFRRSGLLIERKKMIPRK